MSFSRKYIYFFLVGILVLFVILFWIFFNIKKDFEYFEFQNLEIFFDATAKASLNSYARANSFITNWSYFGKTSTGYFPAWVFIQNNKKFSPIERGDPNLSYVVKSINWDITITPAWEWSDVNTEEQYTNISAFQAWPLIASWGVLQDFWGSWHANSDHERTILGIWKKRKMVFIFTQKISLTTAFKKISQKFPDEQFALINLDWWPSTAYFLNDATAFNTTEKLPIIFRFSR